jgi:hypothetical protein
VTELIDKRKQRTVPVIGRAEIAQLEMRLWSVRPRVGNVRNNASSLIEPIAAA